MEDRLAGPLPMQPRWCSCSSARLYQVVYCVRLIQYRVAFSLPTLSQGLPHSRTLLQTTVHFTRGCLLRRPAQPVTRRRIESLRLLHQPCMVADHQSEDGDRRSEFGGSMPGPRHTARSGIIAELTRGLLLKYEEYLFRAFGPRVLNCGYVPQRQGMSIDIRMRVQLVVRPAKNCKG